MRPLQTFRAEARRPLAFSSLLLLLAVAACDTGEGSQPVVAISDSAGVRIAESPPERLEEPAPLEVSSTPHLRIGAAEGDESELFSMPIAAARLSDGRLFVVESGERPSRLLDPDGSFIRWVGAGGDGPAEFRRAAGGGVLAGDTLWIWDGARRRVLFFHPEEGFVRGVGIEPPDGASQVRFVRPLSDGSILHAATNLNPQVVMESDGAFQERITVHLLDGDGTGPRLLTEGPGPRHRVGEQEGAGGQTFLTIQMRDPVFAPFFMVEADGEGRIWSATGERFEVRQTGPSGGLEEIIRVAVEPTPVTSAIRDHYLETTLERAPEPAREGMAAHLDQRGTASALPTFGSLRTNDAGVLWISEYVGHRPGAHPTRWWVARAGSGVEGVVDLPPSLSRILHIGVDEILGVELDELDVPYLVAHRIRR